MWFAPPSFFHLWSRVSEEEWAGDAIATAACQCRTGQGQRAMPAGGRFWRAATAHRIAAAGDQMGLFSTLLLRTRPLDSPSYLEGRGEMHVVG